jgi:PAS domain S-box-containing protein
MIGQGMTRGIYEGQSLGLREGLPLGRGILIAFKQVGDLPVYTTVSRTPTAIVAPWLRTMAALLAVGLPTSLALGLLSLTSLRRRNALGKSDAELRAAFENAATGTALIDSKTNRMLKVNKRLCEIADREASALIGTLMDSLLEVPKEASGQPSSEEVGAATALNRLERPDGSIRWIELGTAQVTSSQITDPSLVIATFHDITERRESQERQLLLSQEVDHRAKNVLAIVQAVVRMEREPGAASYVERVEGRISALGRAHELLAKDGWQGVGLTNLVHDELAAHQNGPPISVNGSEVIISSAAVQPLSMILHELTSFAAKHGALAQPTGKLSISWHVHPQSGALQLDWLEEVGPGGGGFHCPERLRAHDYSGVGGSARRRNCA